MDAGQYWGCNQEPQPWCGQPSLGDSCSLQSSELAVRSCPGRAVYSALPPGRTSLSGETNFHLLSATECVICHWE